MVLAALMYTMLGRVLLGFIFDADSQNYIWRAFIRLTDPVVRVVALITPRAAPHIVLLMFSAIWLLTVRVGLLILVAALGVMPTTGIPAQ